MKQKTKKRPQIVSVVIALACLICLILVIDFVVRTVTRANVTYVVSEGTFSTDNNNGIPEATDKPTEAKDDKKAMKQLLPQKMMIRIMILLRFPIRICTMVLWLWSATLVLTLEKRISPTFLHFLTRL